MVCDGIPVSTLLSSAYGSVETQAIRAADGNKDDCISKTEALACFAGQGSYADPEMRGVFVGEWMDLADQYVEARTPEVLRLIQDLSSRVSGITQDRLLASNYYRVLALSGSYSVAARDYVLKKIEEEIGGLLQAQQKAFSQPAFPITPSKTNQTGSTLWSYPTIPDNSPSNTEEGVTRFGPGTFSSLGFSTSYGLLVQALEANPTEDSKYKILDLMITFKSYSQITISGSTIHSDLPFYTDMVSPYRTRLTALYQQERNSAIKSKLGQLL